MRVSKESLGRAESFGVAPPDVTLYVRCAGDTDLKLCDEVARRFTEGLRGVECYVFYRGVVVRKAPAPATLSGFLGRHSEASVFFKLGLSITPSLCKVCSAVSKREAASPGRPQPRPGRGVWGEVSPRLDAVGPPGEGSAAGHRA